MKLRFLSPGNHGIVDYLAAAALIVSPFILQLGSSNPSARWISVVAGIVVIIVSLATKYRYGAFKIIPFGGHLTLDLLAATSFMLVPFLFKLEGFDAAYYYINAAVVYLVVAVTASESVLADR
ncbi:SPW repeat protein [Chitinophaga sp. GCM10012297]|uniref:SPW repeat protein n=1 Tax=Chitinophaga chungangae TaxID=2821488 RepID=A0ABS3YA69_9BACT|nr:SPW repeat protein [Chitinophaga chungangae]MBO9151526.1 SPW repeat protein [Chitinophaga chungangae]